MLHKRRLKSKGETTRFRKANIAERKRKARLTGLPSPRERLGGLVSFLANERGHIEVVTTGLHHRPRQVICGALHEARRLVW